MPEFNDIVAKDIFPSPGLKDLPIQLSPSTPIGYTVPTSPYDLNRFGGGSSATGNPLGDYLNTFENTAPSLAQQERPVGFNAEAVNVNRYTGSSDFHKLGIELDGSNEQRYGVNQSWGDVLSNGFTGMRRLAANGFVDNWKGYGRMFDSLVTQDWSKLHGDAESMLAIDKTFNDAMNENPIYATKEGENTFWNRETFGNFLQQSGFAVGAAVGMISENLVSKAIEAGLTLTGVGAPAAAAIEVTNDIATANNVGRMARMMGKTKQFFNAAENFKALKRLGDIWKEESVVKNFITSIGQKLPGVDIGFDIAKTLKAGRAAGIAGSELAWDITKVGVGGMKRLMSEANFAFTEARMEAAGTYSDLYSKLYNDQYNATGIAPTEESINKMNKAAMAAADKNFNFNTALLAISNRIQFDNIFKNSKSVNNILKKYGLDEAVENRLKVVGKLGGIGKVVPHYYETGMLGGLGAFKKIAADFGKGKAFEVAGVSLLKGMARVELTEGIQELLQEGSNVYFKDYYTKAYNASFNPDYTPQGSMSNAIDSQLNMQGLKTFMSGALTGLLLHGPQYLGGKALQYGNEKITDAQKTSGMDAVAKAKYYKEKADGKTAAGKHYAEFNAFAKDPSAVFNEAVKNLNFQKEGTTALDDAAKNNDKFTYENIRTAMLEKMISASVRNNTHQGLIDTLQSYGQNMTKEEFEKAFVGADYSSQNKKQASDYTSKVVNAIEFYNKTWNTLQDRYSNRFNPNRFKFGSKEFFNEALKKQALDNYIEIIASNEFKSKDSLDRMTSIFGKISSSKDLGASLANTFNVMGSDINIVKEMEVLEAEIRLKTEQLKVADMPKEDRAKLEKDLEIKKEQLQHITDWKDTKGELLNEAMIDKGLKAFKGYTESKNKESGKNIVVNQQDIEDHFLDFTDYIKLDEKNKKHVDAINMLVNPKNFTDLHDRLYRAADDAYWKMLGEAGLEHVKKEIGDGKSFIISMYDRHGVFDVDGSLINVYDTIEEARKAKDQADANITGTAAGEETVDDTTPKVTIKVKDKNGVESDIEIVEGLQYITESNPTKRVGKDKKEYVTYDQDILKIDKIDKENNTVSVTINNNGESVTYQMEEFAELAGKLFNFSSMSADQKIYFQNRDKILRINVSKITGTFHKITGVHAEKDYSYNSHTVNARLELKQEDGKWVLKVKYTNPVTNKDVLVDFDMAYYKKYAVKDASGKAALDLSILPTIAEAQEKARQERVAKNYSQQIQALQLLVKEQENKSSLRQKRKEDIDAEIKDLLQSIEDDETAFGIANEELAKKFDKRKKGVKEAVESYEKIIREYPEKIKQAKETAAKLEQEKADIQKELEAFQAAKELYTQGLTELEETKEPFLKDESGTIYGEQQAQLETAQSQRVGTMVPESRLDDVILSIEIEQEDINNRLALIYDTIRQMEARLSRFVKYDDLINTIFKTGNTSDKSLDRLKKNLVTLKASENAKSEPDAEKLELINTLLAGINKDLKSLLGTDDLSIIGPAVTQDVLKTLAYLGEYKQKKQYFSELLERSAQLQDKFDEYMMARDQIMNIKTIQDRVNFLKTIQEGITEGYKKINAVNLVTQTSKSVTAITKQAASEFAEYGDIMSDEQVVTGDENDEIFIGDTAKPLVSNGGLFKTADRHYADDRTDMLASPESGRFFRFSESIALDGTYHFIPVSKANDTYGITKETYTDNAGREIEVKNDIKLIVVKKVGNEYKAVGIDGKVLDNPTKDTIVYTSMPNNTTILEGNDAEVLAYLKDPKSPFSVKGMNDDAILNEVVRFKAFRSSILEATKKNTPVQMKVTGRSNGVQRREPLDVTTGLPQELNLQGRLIEDNPSFSDLRHPDGSPITIEVVTNKNSANKSIKAGRLVVTKTQIADNKTKSTTSFQVYNRQLTEKEKENLFEVLLTMLPMYGRKGKLSDERKETLNRLFTEGKITSDTLLRLTTQLTDEETKQFDLAMNYIAGLVHFNQLEAGAKPTNKQFYISKGSLFIGEKEYKFEVDGAITLDNIQAGKDEILEKLYHNVNNALLSGKRKNNKFVTATVKDGKIVEGKKFNTYLEYLLTDKVSGHTPVIYTNIKKYRPTSEVNEPQLRNVYLKYEGPKEQPSGEKPVVQPAAVTTTPGARPVITQSIDPETGFTSYMFVWNGKEEHFNSEMLANTILSKWIKEKGMPAAPAQTVTTTPTTTGTGKSYDFTNIPKDKPVVFVFKSSNGSNVYNTATWNATKKQYIITSSVRENGEVLDVNSDPVQKLQDGFIKSYVDAIDDYKNSAGVLQSPIDVVKQAVAPYQTKIIDVREVGAQLAAAPVSTDAKADIEKLGKQIQKLPFNTINKLGNLLNTKGAFKEIEDVANAVAYSYYTDKNSDFIKAVDAELAALENQNKINNLSTTVPADLAQALANNLAKLQARNKTTDSNNDGNYRLWLPELTKEKENIEEFKKALAKILPQVGLEVADRLINGRAMGQFINGMIRIYQNAGAGTGFHEAFEAVWNSYLTEKEQQTLITEFKNRKGQFTNVFTKETKDHSQASPSDVKEMLAEEFIPYMRSDNGVVVENSPVRNTLFRKILNFFKKIWNNIQEAFGIIKESPENSEINNLFRKIAQGGFANATTIDKEGVEEIPAFRSTLEGTDVEFTHKLMEGMMSYFFMELYKGDNNIKALFDKSKPELFNELYDKVKNRVLDRFSENVNDIMTPLLQQGFDQQTVQNQVSNIPFFKNQALANYYFNTPGQDKVRDLFKKYLSQFGLQFENVKVKVDDEIVDATKPQENEITDRLGIVEAIYIDPRDAMKAEVKLLIASLTSDEYNTKGEIVNKRNELGLPMLEDFGRKINILHNELHSIVPVSRYDAATKSIVVVPTLDQMFDKLDDRFKRDGQYKTGYEWIDKLKNRLNYQDRTTGQKSDIASLSNDEISLIVAFETSFSNNRNNPYKIIVGKDGNIYSDNSLDSTNAKRIKERWQNNIKAEAKEFFGTTPEELANGPMIYINADGVINFNIASEQFKKIMDVTSPISMVASLRKLGFDFTMPDDELVLQAGGAEISKDFSAIKSKFEDESIKTFDDLFGKQIVNGRINSLIKIEQDTTSDDNILSVRNAEGKQQYSITLPSAISYLANSFKACKNLTDFVASNPQLGSIDLETGDVKLNSYTAGARLLKKGEKYSLFDEKGNKKKDAKLEYRYVIGMSGETESIGTSTDRLEFSDKVVQEAFHLLDGTYFTIINSDKSSEFGLNYGHLIAYDTVEFGAPGNSSEILDAYKDALKDELRTAKFEKGNNKYKIQYYSDSVQNLGHFVEILQAEKNDTIKKLLTEFMDGKKTEDEFINDPTVGTLISNYLQAEVNENIKWLQDLGLISYDKKTDTIKTKMFAAEQLSALDDNLKYDKEGGIQARYFRKLMTFFTVNRQLGVFEQHKLLFGHPALYKELAKRSSGINSQKQVISENPAYLEWMDRNLTRFDGKTQRTNTFKFISHTDPKAVSKYINDVAEGIYESMKASFVKDGAKLSKTDKTFIEKLIGATFNEDGTLNKIVGGKGTLVDGYENAEETDGGAYIMPDFFRDMHFLSGKLSNEQDDLLRYENAREIIDRSNPNHPMYGVAGFAKTYTQGEIDDAVTLLAGWSLIDDKPKAVLPVLKPQGFGYQTTQGIMHTTLLKHSVVPLTWSRVVDKPNMLTKYIDAQTNQVDIIGFTSGQKVGAFTELDGNIIQPLYTKDGATNTTASPIQEMYTKYYGFQVEIAPYSKESVIFGSQMRKINLSNIPEDATELRAWAEEYNKLIDSLTSTEFKGVLKDLGLRQEGDGYITDNLQGMLDTLRKEIERRDLPDNVVNMLAMITDANTGERYVQYKFDASPVRDKLDNILNSIVDSRILAQTMHGKASVQVPSTMFEKSDRLFTYKDKDGKYVEPVKGSEIPKGKKAVMVSSELNFPTKAKPYMEVIVPNFFKELFKEGQEINISELDPRLLQAIGFRIPTQSMAQIGSIRIAGFLDPQWGDMIVVPTEIVAQAGSDFDIDKLNLFLANYYIDRKTNKPTYIEYSTSKADVENRYSTYVNDNVDGDTKAYAKTLEGYSNEKGNIIEKYADNKDVIFTKFKEARKSYDSQYEESKNNILKIANQSKNSDDNIAGYKREGYALFSTLPQAIKQPFYDLKNAGVQAIAENKALAEKLLQANPDAKYASTLMQMIQYHEAMMDVYGQINEWTEEQINSLSDKANAALGEWKNWKESSLEQTREGFLKSLKEYNLEYAKELARIAGLPTLEEFKNLPIEEQNSKKARQNRLIELMSDILGHPANYRQLVTPNGTATLKAIATKIRELKGLPAEEGNKTSLSEWKTMAEVRERYITGKTLVGVIALQITSHSMSQYGEVELTGTYMKNGNPMSIKIKFDSNTSEGKYMLNLIEDKGHQWISELLSEAMTAAVDAAKDPFIFDLNLTINTANVWFYLQKLGVKVKDIAYLHTQPIIEKYFDELSKNKSLLNETNKTKLSKTAVKYLAMEDFLFKAFPQLQKEFNKKFQNGETFKEVVMTDGKPLGYNFNALKKMLKEYLKEVEPTSILSTKTLESMIKPSGANKAEALTKEEALVQLAILDDYGNYEDQGSLLSNFIAAISYDTSRTKNVIENKLQQGVYKQAVKDNFVTKESLNRVMKKTFLGKIKQIKDSVPDMFKDFLVVVHPKTAPIMEKMIDTVLADQYMPKADKIDYLNRYQNYVLSYILHTVKANKNGKDISIYSYYKNLLTGTNSIPKQLKEYQKTYPDNKALKNLFSIINTNTKDTDGIKLFAAKLSTFEINSISEDLVKLRDTATSNNDKGLLSFINNLGAFLIVQSGVQQSPITFSKVMPIDLYSQLVHDILTRFITNDDVQIDPEIVWRQFHQNNYKNAKFVDIISPSQLQRDEEFFDIYDEASAIHNATNPSLEYIYGKGEFVTVQQLKPEVEDNKALYAQLAKNKQWDKVYDYTLYQRIGEAVEGGASPYMPINKLGNGMYMTEATPDEFASSILEKNGNLNSEYYKEQAHDLLSRMDTIIDEENTDVKVKKIISGGQTGVDRIGLEAGKEIGLQTGGTATPGFATETGKDLTLRDFGVEEISSELQAGKSGKEFYLPRTEQNVLNSDGTVYFATDEDSAGRIATERFAKKHNKPFLLNPTVEQLRKWLASNNIETLNVAGNRGSKLSKEKAEEIKNTIKEALSLQTDMGRQTEIESGYGLTAANFQDDTEINNVLNQKEDESKQCNQ